MALRSVLLEIHSYFNSFRRMSSVITNPTSSGTTDKIGEIKNNKLKIVHNLRITFIVVHCLFLNNTYVCTVELFFVCRLCPRSQSALCLAEISESKNSTSGH